MKNSLSKISAMVMAFVLMMPFKVFANTNNATEFNSLWTRVEGWVTGIPAVIIALAVGILGVVRAFQSGSFIWALAGILTAAVIFLLPTIIGGLGGVTF